jgi:hypothetical protein
MAPPISYPALTELQLARLVEIGHQAARDEVKRRYAKLACQLARRICGKIAHRGGRCPGRSGSIDDCDQAFTWIELDLLDRFAGHPPGVGHRRRKALVVTWLHQRNRPRTFAAYVWGRHGKGLPGMETEGRRVWNRQRQLKSRLHPPSGFAASGPARYAELIADSQLATAARMLGLTGPDAPWRWLRVLFDDACDVGYEEQIDVARVTRHLLAGTTPTPFEQMAVALLAPAVDAMLSRNWPLWWDEYLDRPRQHTRAFAPLPTEPGVWPWTA